MLKVRELEMLKSATVVCMIEVTEHKIDMVGHVLVTSLMTHDVRANFSSININFLIK